MYDRFWNDAGGYDISVKICKGSNNCCQVYFGEMDDNAHKEKQISDCHLRFNRGNPPQVQVVSSSNNQFIPRFVDVWTQNEAMFQGRFNDDWVHLQSPIQISIVFGLPASSNNELPSVPCPAPSEITCPVTSMIIDGNAGQHNYVCDFPCATGVASLNPASVGKGFRCFTSNFPQEKLKYCCLDGPRGEIPGCTPTNHRNAPRIHPNAVAEEPQILNPKDDLNPVEINAGQDINEPYSNDNLPSIDY